jgi:preprotein translocase subunit SecA
MRTPSVLRHDDKVWFDSARKFQHLVADVAAAHADGRNVLLLSHFEFTITRLNTLLSDSEIPHQRFSLFDSAALCGSPAGKVWIGDVRAFRAPGALLSETSSLPLEILIAEHHPLRSRDEEIIAAAAKLPCQTGICFYFSLDDPLMIYFGAVSIQEMFKRLNIPQDEAITHHLVTTAIATAQQKLESKAPKDVPAHSVEDWFKYNLPGKY